MLNKNKKDKLKVIIKLESISKIASCKVIRATMHQQKDNIKLEYFTLASERVNI